MGDYHAHFNQPRMVGDLVSIANLLYEMVALWNINGCFCGDCRFPDNAADLSNFVRQLIAPRIFMRTQKNDPTGFVR
jgi:hypothetical protein